MVPAAFQLLGLKEKKGQLKELQEQSRTAAKRESDPDSDLAAGAVKIACWHEECRAAKGHCAQLQSFCGGKEKAKIQKKKREESGEEEERGTKTASRLGGCQQQQAAAQAAKKTEKKAQTKFYSCQVTLIDNFKLEIKVPEQLKRELGLLQLGISSSTAANTATSILIKVTHQNQPKLHLTDLADIMKDAKSKVS